jgi:hypothetical protein
MMCYRAIRFTTILLFTIEMCLANGMAQSYKADGRMTYMVRNPHGALDIMCHFTFTIWVNGRKWFIETSVNGRKDLEPYEDAYDGQYVYSLTTFIDKLGAPHSSGIIESNDVPQESSFYASPIWLALGSSHYFQSITNNLFQPIWHLSDITLRNKRFSDVGKWIKQDASPFLPEEVTYYSDGKIYFTDSYGNSRVSRYPAPYDNGFIEAEYNVITHTNVGGITLPQHFVFIRYMPRPYGRSTNDTVIMCKYDGTVTNISSENIREGYIPVLSPPTYVDDRRFGVAAKPVTDVEYVATNSWWPSVTNTVVARLYREKAFNSPVDIRTIERKPLPKSVIYGILFGSTLCFVFLLFKTMQTNKTK